ncbi:MAG: Flp family type IVb pilin, partial [Mesorhizobium sp.]
MTMKNLLQQFIEDESGATAIEYGLIVAVLSLVIVG